MSDNTHIEWTDATWNPITGCSVVSAGCKHCYAMKLAGTRLQYHPSRAGLTVDTSAGPVWTGEVRLNLGWIDQPLRWRRPRRIFVCAHGDLFHKSVPDEWIDRVFAVMALASQHTFQVLTKRADRMREYCTSAATVGRLVALLSEVGAPVRTNHVADGFGGVWLPNVWLGVSVENQAAADERIPHLLQTPAAVRWLSAEPLLGRVDLCEHLGMWWNQTMGCFEGTGERLNVATDGRPRIGWVVAGGESGDGARPMHPEWARALRRQCDAAGVPFLFKQWGAWRPPADGESYDTSMGQAQRVPCYIVAPAGTVHCFENGAWTNGGTVMRRVGKKAAGRHLDGVVHDAYPELAA